MEKNKRGKMNTVIAGIAGAAVGAGATAAAIALSKKENRQKVKGALKNIKKKGDNATKKISEAVEDIKQRSMELRKEGTALTKKNQKNQKT